MVKGLQEEPEFGGKVMKEADTLDSDKVEAETVKAAKEMVAKNPDMGAIVIECSMLPPYSKAVQEATGLPVYDFITMIDHLYAATHQQRYDGAY